MNNKSSRTTCMAQSNCIKKRWDIFPRESKVRCTFTFNSSRQEVVKFMHYVRTVYRTIHGQPSKDGEKGILIANMLITPMS